MSPVLEGGREGGLGLVLSPLFTDRPGVFGPLLWDIHPDMLSPLLWDKRGTSSPLSVDLGMGWTWFGRGLVWAGVWLYHPISPTSGGLGPLLWDIPSDMLSPLLWDKRGTS